MGKNVPSTTTVATNTAYGLNNVDSLEKRGVGGYRTTESSTTGSMDRGAEGDTTAILKCNRQNTITGST